VQFSGVEQLTLDGMAGDDTYQVAGVSTKTIFVDSKGTDLLDFSNSQATVGVTIDLSKSSGTAQKIFAPINTNNLALKGTFENAIGTPLAALAAVMREWASDKPYADRRTGLDTGFTDPLDSGFIQLKKKDKTNPKGTVIDDRIRDQFFGGEVNDWLFNFTSDEVSDSAFGDVGT
jgi:hypothetical protein